MRAAIVAFALALTLFSIALMLADYSRHPAETHLGMLLGRFYLQDDFWSIEELRPRIRAIGYASAAKVIKPVLERDASSAYRWTDLGEIFSRADDKLRAEYCYRRAEELAPHDPQILYAVADFYANEGRIFAAVRRFAAILTLMTATKSDILTNGVFNYYERIEIRKLGLLEQAIPDAENARAYTRYMIQKGDPLAAKEVWQWIRGRAFDDEPLTIGYVNFLFQKKEFDAAEVAWTQCFAGRKDGYGRLLPVFNGGFEYEWTGGVPDWRFDGWNGVRVVRDHASSFEGQFSLRIDFSGNDNPDFHHVQETVFVQPGVYRFEAHVRTEKVTSDQGILFRIVSARDGKALAETDALTGTNDWKRLNSTVQIPHGTRLVMVELTRLRSIRIDNQLTGTVWIDDVKLTRVE
jgi:tetratricopeptide (TPR) repeat protein